MAKGLLEDTDKIKPLRDRSDNSIVVPVFTSGSGVENYHVLLDDAELAFPLRNAAPRRKGIKNKVLARDIKRRYGGTISGRRHGGGSLVVFVTALGEERNDAGTKIAEDLAKKINASSENNLMMPNSGKGQMT